MSLPSPVLVAYAGAAPRLTSAPSALAGSPPQPALHAPPLHTLSIEERSESVRRKACGRSKEQPILPVFTLTPTPRLLRIDTWRSS